MRAELFRWSGGTALSLLTGDGGTALIPGDVDADELEPLFAALTHAAGVPITAAVAHCPSDALPTWADRTHCLLDMVQRLGVDGRLHHFADLALEYQLTRPGPGRDFLAALLDPLDEHAELFATLQCHIAHDVNRQRTARPARASQHRRFPARAHRPADRLRRDPQPRAVALAVGAGRAQLRQCGTVVAQRLWPHVSSGSDRSTARRRPCPG